jgi:hypothetical protein
MPEAWGAVAGTKMDAMFFSPKSVILWHAFLHVIVA